jgi:hypothetical protein
MTFSDWWNFPGNQAAGKNAKSTQYGNENNPNKWA